MTPQEKATELVEYFSKLMNYSSYALPLCESTAKQCALIAVDEILKNNCGSYMSGNYMAENNEIYCDECYWQDVKSEIEKL